MKQNKKIFLFFLILTIFSTTIYFYELHAQIFWKKKGEAIFDKSGLKKEFLSQEKNNTILSNNISVDPYDTYYQYIQFEVIPWNNHSSAISLTFDDALPCHRTNTIPALEARGIYGTFFLPNFNQYFYWNYKIQWKNLAHTTKQEMGNHSDKHYHPCDLTSSQFTNEILDWKQQLETDLATNIYTYAYPFCDTGCGVKYTVSVGHFLARGCGGSNPYIQFNDEPDWYDIPTKNAAEGMTFTNDFKNWVDTALSQKAWLVILFHGIGQEGTYANIPMNEFIPLLDYITNQNIWADTFANVGGYLMAHCILKNKKVQKINNEHKLVWNVPKNFPLIKLKMKIIKPVNCPASQMVIMQNSNEIHPDTNGYYTINFNVGEIKFKFK